MKIITDTLKEKGRWSRSSLMMFFTFWSNIIFAGYETVCAKRFPDLPANWLALILFLYGMNKGAAVAAKHINKGVTDDTTTDTP